MSIGWKERDANLEFCKLWDLMMVKFSSTGNLYDRWVYHGIILEIVGIVQKTISATKVQVRTNALIKRIH